MAKIDLKTLTRKELEKLGNDIEKALKRIREKEFKEAKAAAEKTLKAHGFSLADISGMVGKSVRKPSKRRPKPSVAKFANPADKTQTWTGRGRQPDWFKAAIESGTDESELKI